MKNTNNKDVFQELDSLSDELGITEERVHELLGAFANANWIMTKMLKDPLYLETTTVAEQMVDYEAYVKYLNSSSIDERTRIYRRFINYCRWLNKV